MFCLIVSWVFVIETIAGSQIIKFCPEFLNLVSDLRKMYCVDCQTMIQFLVKFQILINFLKQMLDSALDIVIKSAGYDF